MRVRAGQPLEVAHHVIGGVADQAPGERHAREVGPRLRRGGERRAQAREQLGTVGRRRAALGPDRETRLIEPHLEPVAEADEGIAAEPLAALDALEQEARRERAELHERRDRRVEITGDVEGGLQGRGSKNTQDNKKPIPGSSGDGFLVPLNRFESRGKS